MLQNVTRDRDNRVLISGLTGAVLSFALPTNIPTLPPFRPHLFLAQKVPQLRASSTSVELCRASSPFLHIARPLR